MREWVGVWNNTNIWVIIEWYLHVAGYVFLLIVGVCVVVCVVLVCVAVKTGVEDVSNILLCAGSWLRVCCFWPWFFEKTTCYTVMVLYCTRVHQLDVYCHSTVLLLFWILSYLRVKENVIVWLLLFGCFHVKLRGSVLCFDLHCTLLLKLLCSSSNIPGKETQVLTRWEGCWAWELFWISSGHVISWIVLIIDVSHKAFQELWGGADKSLARPARKQATATKLGIYSAYSPRSSVHFLAHCSNFC